MYHIEDENEDSIGLEKVLSNCLDLTHLRLDLSGSYPTSLSSLQQPLALTRLEFRSYTNLDTHYLQILLTLISNSPWLEELRVGSIFTENLATKVIAAINQHCSSVKILHLFCRIFVCESFLLAGPVSKQLAISSPYLSERVLSEYLKRRQFDLQELRFHTYKTLPEQKFWAAFKNTGGFLSVRHLLFGVKNFRGQRKCHQIRHFDPRGVPKCGATLHLIFRRRFYYYLPKNPWATEF